jgi:hypothetical protein
MPTDNGGRNALMAVHETSGVISSISKSDEAGTGGFTA